MIPNRAAAAVRLLTIRPIKVAIALISQLRGEDVANQLAPLLTPAERVLDLGCGTGGVSLALRNRGFDVVPVDIVDLAVHEEIAVTVVPPNRLPFGDDMFEACILHMTLHHAVNPQLLVKEARRVATRIIVGEELADTPLSRTALRLYDRLANFCFVDVPQQNRSDKMWRKLFCQNGLTVRFAYHTRVFCFIRQVLYVLERNNHDH